jgi:ribonuclease HI
MKTNTEITVYTGSAWEHNPGRRGKSRRRCGWGYVAYNEGKKIFEQCGGEYAVTCNRMELTAAIKAIEMYGDKFPNVHIVSSLTYLVDGASKWLKNWKAKGWKGAGKQDIKNLDLWMKIDHLTQKHSVSWGWVKGHSGIAGNERADKLANTGMFTFDS